MLVHRMVKNVKDSKVLAKIGMKDSLSYIDTYKGYEIAVSDKNIPDKFLTTSKGTFLAANTLEELKKKIDSITKDSKTKDKIFYPEAIIKVRGQKKKVSKPVIAESQEEAKGKLKAFIAQEDSSAEILEMTCDSKTKDKYDLVWSNGKYEIYEDENGEFELVRKSNKATVGQYATLQGAKLDAQESTKDVYTKNRNMRFKIKGDKFPVGLKKKVKDEEKFPVGSIIRLNIMGAGPEKVTKRDGTTIWTNKGNIYHETKVRLYEGSSVKDFQIKVKDSIKSRFNFKKTKDEWMTSAERAEFMEKYNKEMDIAIKNGNSAEIMRLKRLLEKAIQEGKTKDVDNIKSKIIAFFKANPNPDDEKIHAFAEAQQINPHELETNIYALLSERLTNDVDYKLSPYEKERIETAKRILKQTSAGRNFEKDPMTEKEAKEILKLYNVNDTKDDLTVWKKGSIVVLEKDDSKGKFYQVYNTKTGKQIGSDYNDEQQAIAQACKEVGTNDAWQGPPAGRMDLTNPGPTEKQYEQHRGYYAAQAGKPKEPNASAAWVKGYEEYFELKKRGLIKDSKIKDIDNTMLKLEEQLKETIAKYGEFSEQATSKKDEIKKIKGKSPNYINGLFSKDADDKSFDIRNIEKETIENDNFRKVLFTGNNIQLVLMSLLPNEDIGMEVHKDVDQFFRIDEGGGQLDIQGEGKSAIEDGTSIVIKAGTYHNIIAGDKGLKLYTVYAPPNHPADRIQKTKAEAAEAKDEGVPSKLEKQGHSGKSAQKIAAYIGRKKYGKEAFQKMAAAGKK